MRTIALLALFATAILAVPGGQSGPEAVQLYRRRYVPKKGASNGVDDSNDERDGTPAQPPTTPPNNGQQPPANGNPTQPPSNGTPGKNYGDKYGRRKHRGRFFGRLMKNEGFRKAFWKWWRTTGKKYAEQAKKELGDDEDDKDTPNTPAPNTPKPNTPKPDDGDDEDDKDVDSREEDRNPLPKKKTYTRN